jgi:hypothetical protein
VHWPNGWYFGAPNGGWEFIAVLLAGLLVQAGLGDGQYALANRDRRLNQKRTGAAAGAQGRRKQFAATR